MQIPGLYPLFQSIAYDYDTKSQKHIPLKVIKVKQYGRIKEGGTRSKDEL